MVVLTTRNIRYRKGDGREVDVTLTVFVPFKTEREDWKCEFLFSGLVNDSIRHVYGADYLQALLSCLEVARGYIEHPVEERTHWQGMPHSGLPWRAEKPSSYRPPELPAQEIAPPHLETLTARKLGSPSNDGTAGSLLLTVYKPFQASDGTWKCAFSLGPVKTALVSYGVGVDFIEALLNGLALARVAYEGMESNVSLEPETGEVFDPRYLPYNIGRAYWMDP